MSLLDLAEADLEFTLEDSEFGFGTSIKLIDGLNEDIVNGQYHRIGIDIDPGTGMQVSANRSSITVRLSSLINVDPKKGINIECTDITGTLVKGRADEVMKDRTLGIVTIFMRVN